MLPGIYASHGESCVPGCKGEPKPPNMAKEFPTAAIADLYEAGEEIEDIADEYDCITPEVTAAIKFETPSRAA